MEIAYFSEFTLSEQVIRAADGDAESFGVRPDAAIPMEETYCRRMVAGLIPNLVADTHTNPILKDLPATSDARIRAYIGVPVQLPAGPVYGTLCCASHRPSERLGDSDVRFLRILARLLADELDRQEHPLAAVAVPRWDGNEDVRARLSLWFAGAPRAAPAARQAIASLSEQVPEDTLYQLNLLVTELVTNAVRHAGIGPASSVGLEVTVGDDVISVAVTDPGPGFDADVGVPDPLDEGGRGLFLVQQIANRWGVENEHGTRVWFELTRRRPDAE
jgi:anti-sigma regulatory factor (Ser/Thr protein kinase)